MLVQALFSAESLLAKFLLAAADVLVVAAGGTELDEAVGSAVVGQVIDAVYAKAIGDILSVPLKELSIVAFEDELARLSRGRIAEQSSMAIGDGNLRFRADMDATLAVEYDPLTRTVSGVIISTCAPEGRAFFYRVDPRNWHVAAATQVWNGRVHFIISLTLPPEKSFVDPTSDRIQFTLVWKREE